ncbi:MAG: ATP-binding cassette domain-containing protein [Campylobacteraceae bacterium]
MITISAKNLTKFFQKAKTPALNNISFDIKSKEITGLVGPDGAGKTTLIRLIATLLKTSEGTLSVLGEDIQKKENLLEDIGYMPQKFGLYEDLSIDENLSLYADLQGIEDKTKRIDELLEFTKLKPFRSRRAGKLSGGMKQKLGLACALIKKPKILLLDEPCVGVDPISRRDLWSLTKSLVNEDITVIWGTSYLDEAQMCDSVLLLNEGNLLFFGEPKEAMSKLENRVFLITGEIENKREAISTILEYDEFMDAIIVSSDIKVTLRKDKTFPHEVLEKIGKNLEVKKIEPNFEDAFVDILGVKTKAHSNLVAAMQDVKKHDKKLIEAKHLTKKFGDFTATDDISFSVGQGEIFGFLGPNGAGKSTTFKMLCGLLLPTSGEARVLGENLYTSPSTIKENIGYMAQKFSLYGNISVKANLDFFAGIYGLYGKKQKEKVDMMIETFAFDRYLHVSANELPLGIKQRLALACSFMHEPPVLFLDEPTSGVDPITRKEFWMHINSMVKKGISVMVTTHFMDEAEYCDRIMLIYKGKSIALGTPDELKRSVGKNASMEDTFIELVQNFDKENEPS